MMGQEPLFLSADAVALLAWARNEPSFRDAYSCVMDDPIKQERVIVGPRQGHYDDGYKRYPMRLYQSWFYAGQWCPRQVYERLGWDKDRHDAARRELVSNGYARSTGFGDELTERGWELEVECPEVVAVR